MNNARRVSRPLLKLPVLEIRKIFPLFKILKYRREGGRKSSRMFVLPSLRVFSASFVPVSLFSFSLSPSPSLLVDADDDYEFLRRDDDDAYERLDLVRSRVFPQLGKGSASLEEESSAGRAVRVPSETINEILTSVKTTRRIQPGPVFYTLRHLQ